MPATVFVTTSGPYVELHAGGHRFVIRESMPHLEEQLDPGRFLRIHRSEGSGRPRGLSSAG